MASEDIITKFKSHGLYTIKIKYWNASGCGFPPSLIPALQNIGILHHKKAELRILLQQSVFIWESKPRYIRIYLVVELFFWRFLQQTASSI